jgi:hypothetical protein
VQITAAIEARNAKISDNRQKELQFRKETQDQFDADTRQWEKDEAERIASLLLCKRNARMLNISIESSLDRIALCENEKKSLRERLEGLQTWSTAHKEASSRYLVLRSKHMLERKRLLHCVFKLKRRLVYILESRRKALELPGATISAIDFEYATKRSENLLKQMRFEIVGTTRAYIFYSLICFHRWIASMHLFLKASDFEHYLTTSP